MQSPDRRDARLRVLIRALLSAVAVVILIPVAFAVGGGYFPRLPVVGPFGAIINTGLPWILGAAAVATGLAATAVVLAGRRLSVLLVVSIVVLAATGFVGYRYASVASANGASYDLLRATDGYPRIPKPTDHIVFATVDGAELGADLWLPANAGDVGDAGLPAVVFVHGGSFIGGAPGTRPLLMEALARAGVVGLDIQYRLSPPPRWNQAPGDVLCALAWMGSVDGLEMVDSRRIVVVGESAGGSLALMAASGAGTDSVKSSCPEAGPAPVPAGVVAIAPAADLAGIWTDATIRDFSGNLVPEAYIGGTPSQFPDRYEAASPFHLLRANLPPALIIAAENDRFVHLDRITNLVDRIRAAGSDCDLILAPFADHGFDGEPNSFGQQLTESVIPAFVTRVTAR